MGISLAYKFCAVALLSVTLCYGKDLHKNIKGNTLDVKNTTDEAVTPILQHGYDYDNNAPRGVVIVTPIVSLLLIGCCVYFCCRCRSQRNAGVIVNTHVPAAPSPITQTIVFQQQPAQPPPQPMPYAQQHVQAPYPQQHVPPPYDTQPYPQQQFQPAPTAYANPNYAPQPPVNMQYGQEKY